MNTPTAQDEHQAATVGCSQKARLLARLQQSIGEWVPSPELACAMSASGTGNNITPVRRIMELRDEGWKILLADEREGGQRKTSYKLVGRDSVEPTSNSSTHEQATT